MSMNDTPNSNRLHIGIFGRSNSGKSSFINALTNQEVSIVADIAGTTTDPVYKPMEINPIGPCVLIDTAGFDDESTLGEQRVEKTRLAAQKTDLAIFIIAADQLLREENDLYYEENWYDFFKQNNTPVLFVINKTDIYDENVEEHYQEFLDTNRIWNKLKLQIIVKWTRNYLFLYSLFYLYLPIVLHAKLQNIRFL